MAFSESNVVSATVDVVPNPLLEPYTISDFPNTEQLVEQMLMTNVDPTKGGEVQRAQLTANPLIMPEYMLREGLRGVVQDCVTEMQRLETVAREPAEQRLERLKLVAPQISTVLDFSAAGDYYHYRKGDRYEHTRTAWGMDRVRADQAAILAIVLSGIREGWQDKDLLPFLNSYIFTNDNSEVNALRPHAVEAVKQSGIKIAYVGREDEIRNIQSVLRQKGSFIPDESVDLIGPEGVDNVIHQTDKLRGYLAQRLLPHKSVIMPLNIQASRIMRAAKTNETFPPNRGVYVYAMPTAVRSGTNDYRTNEIKGAVYRALTNEASSVPAPFELI